MTTTVYTEHLAHNSDTRPFSWAFSAAAAGFLFGLGVGWFLAYRLPFVEAWPVAALFGGGAWLAMLTARHDADCRRAILVTERVVDDDEDEADEPEPQRPLVQVGPASWRRPELPLSAAHWLAFLSAALDNDGRVTRDGMVAAELPREFYRPGDNDDGWTRVTIPALRDARIIDTDNRVTPEARREIMSMATRLPPMHLSRARAR